MFNIKIIVFFIASFLFIVFPIKAIDTTIESEKITDYHVVVKVQKNGTIKILEKITYDFGPHQRHGIFRNIPYKVILNSKELNLPQKDKTNIYKLEINDVSVTNELRKPYQFTQSTANDTLQLKIGDPNSTITGIHTYSIAYEVSGAMRYFNDHDELYWNITGNDWSIPIQNAHGTVELPSEISPDAIKGICYTGLLNSTSEDCSSFISKGTVSFSSTHLINPNEGLTIAVSLPKGFITKLLPTPVIPFFSTIIGKIVMILLVCIALFWYVLYPFWLPIKWYFYGRDPYVGIPVTAYYDAPKNKEGKLIGPGETGALIDEIVDFKDVSAVIVDLARRGYLHIIEQNKNDFRLDKKYMLHDKQYSQLRVYERDFLAGLFSSNKKSVLLKDNVSLVTVVENLKQDMYKTNNNAGFFVKDPNNVRKFYSAISILAIFSGNILLAVNSFLFGKNMPQKTLFGAGQANKAKGLRNFLKSQERQITFQGNHQMLFEKLLPFAIAFGVERAWAKRFADMQLKPPNWYSGVNTTNFNSILLTEHVSSSLSSVKSASTPVTHSSSGFSSGGGFSGGGGGGGGGGSW